MTEKFDVRDSVRERYGEIASGVLSGSQTSGCCGSPTKDPITKGHYGDDQASLIPEDALAASLGCGNPTLLAELHEGEVVLDLGCGGGIDVLLSARRVGESGKAYGLDMTDEMLELARRNQAASGLTNVEFLKGHIESIPLPDKTVDVILSNCVINLSGDKDAVLREAFRVLKPGGRFAVADIVTHDRLPESVMSQVAFWTGCVSGALQDDEYIGKLQAAGFVDVSIQPIRTYSAEDASEFVASESSCCGGETSCADDEASVDPEVARQLAASVYSGFIRAVKPRE